MEGPHGGQLPPPRPAAFFWLAAWSKQQDTPPTRLRSPCKSGCCHSAPHPGEFIFHTARAGLCSPRTPRRSPPWNLQHASERRRRRLPLPSGSTRRLRSGGGGEQLPLTRSRAVTFSSVSPRRRRDRQSRSSLPTPPLKSTPARGWSWPPLSLSRRRLPGWRRRTSKNTSPLRTDGNSPS